MGEVIHIKGHPVLREALVIPADQNRQGNELWAELKRLASVMPGTSEEILNAAAVLARDYGIRSSYGYAVGLSTMRRLPAMAGLHVDLAIGDILDLIEGLTPEDAEGPITEDE